MTATDWKTITEIVVNILTALAIIGGVAAWWKWLAERHDRATEVLFKLEERFDSEDNRKARKFIENDTLYQKIRIRLIEAVLFANASSKEVPSATSAASSATAREEMKVLQDLEVLDCFLRFYVFLYGVRAARQVPDASLRICYRYWLAHYYHPQRVEFRTYINEFFPTLRKWLKADKTLSENQSRLKFLRRPQTKFFQPEDFGWTSRPRKPLADAMRGRVLVLTGSGISAESGISTFRGKDGYWLNNDPKKLATTKGFNDDPTLVWKWYDERRNLIRSKTPNEAHRAVASLAELAANFLLVTQNVDDLHDRTGLPEDKLVHIHGKIFKDVCTKCGYQGEPLERSEPTHECPRCGHLLRPGVVWFDEELDPAEERKVEDFLAGGRCDLVLVVGTTATFSYIADWAIRGAGCTGWLVEVNIEETAFTPFANCIARKPAAEALPKLVRNELIFEPKGEVWHLADPA